MNDLHIVLHTLRLLIFSLAKFGAEYNRNIATYLIIRSTSEISEITTEGLQASCGYNL